MAASTLLGVAESQPVIAILRLVCLADEEGAEELAAVSITTHAQ